MSLVEFAEFAVDENEYFLSQLENRVTHGYGRPHFTLEAVAPWRSKVDVHFVGYLVSGLQSVYHGVFVIYNRLPIKREMRHYAADLLERLKTTTR